MSDPLTSDEREALFERLRRTDATADAVEALVMTATAPDPADVNRPAEAPTATICYRTTPAPFTVRLARPFTVDGKLVRSVDLRAPSFATVRAVLDGDVPRIAMYAEMSGLPVEALDALAWQDGELVFGAAAILAPEIRS